MKRLVLLVTVFAISLNFASSVIAQEDKPASKESSEAIEILKKVDAAAKAVKIAKYKATYKGTGGRPVDTVEGTVVIKGWTGGSPEKFFADVTIKKPNASEPLHITIGGDGEEYYVTDHAAKKSYVDIDPMVLGSTGRPAQNLFTLEFVHPTPFSDEINAPKQELRGSKTIGGVDCYEIFVEYADGRTQAVWHFGKKDFLPRARLDIRKNPQGEEVRRQRIITDLVVDSAVSEDVFKFKLPKGFEKVDDFAP